MYVKVFSDLLDSSLWAEDSDTRIVWLTMLMLADPDGLVRATMPGIAHRARVSQEATTRALTIFESPDLNSRTPDNEGRRIERTDGGYMILNFVLYHNTTDREQQREQTRERVRAYRERNKSNTADCNGDVTPVTPGNATQTHTQTHTKTQNKTKKKNTYDPDFLVFWDAYPRRIGKTRTFKKWISCLAGEAKADVLIRCAWNYAEACRIKETPEQYILLPATFLGPDARWEDYTDENYRKPEPVKPKISGNIQTGFDGNWGDGKP